MSLGRFWARADLKGLYHLENVNDSSGNSHTLTNYNTVTFTAGKFNNAANLGNANSNKYLMVNDDLDIHGGNITIFCWVKLLAEIGSSTWVFCEQSSATGYNCYSIRYQYNSGTRRLYFFRDKYGSGGTGVYVTKTLGTSDWNMLTLVYDNTNVYAYVNGVLAAAPVAASGSGSSSLGDHFAIGRAPSGDASSYYASALVDMVAVFNTAWSAADVRRWYAFSRGMLV